MKPEPEVCYYCGVDEEDCSSDLEVHGGHLECSSCYGVGRHLG